MSDLAAKNDRFLRDAYRLAFGSPPDARSLQWASQILSHGCDPRDFLICLASQAGAGKIAERGNTVPLFVPPGHFYSPIVDPAALDRSTLVEPGAGDALPGISIDDHAMSRFFDELKPLIKGTRFPERKQPGRRYFIQNDFFGAGDATILSCMIRRFLPKRIIEVGSGFSSAVILDTIGMSDALEKTECTFVEPNPERLHSLLSDADRARTEIISREVQSVPLSRFEALSANDILFLDTTHVSKTGSDVNFEIFNILPRLNPGVIVHFHDIFDNFEYPLHWMLHENRSWNEQYILRAYLMNNASFEIVFFNHRFITKNEEWVRSCSPRMADQPGGSLWLRKR